MKRALFFAIFCLLNSAALSSREVGEVIHSERGSYSLLEKLGEGAFGKVFKAVDGSGTLYAVKYFKGGFKSNEKSDGHSYNIFFNSMLDVKREYERGQLFDHPHIIKSIDMFSAASGDEVSYYLVLEYVPGKTVSNTARRSLTKCEAVEAIKQLVDGLRHAYTVGYIHLDLHNSNLMLSDSSDVMIIDLASFFSWQELMGYVKEESEEVEKKGLVVESDIVRKKKIEEFFAKNSALYLELKKIFSLNARAIAGDEEKVERAKLYFHAFYFDRITSAAIGIVDKSNLDKETKLALKTDIKRLSWSFEEDSEDGLSTLSSLEEYVDELLSAVESHGK